MMDTMDETNLDTMSKDAAAGLAKMYYKKLLDTERKLQSILEARSVFDDDVEISGGRIFRLIPPD